MLAQYGEHCMAQTSVCEWSWNIWGWEENSWCWTIRPAFGITDDHRAEVDALIKGNRRTSVREIALTVGISYWSAFAIDHDYLSDRDS
jgi:hypothetical protein